MAILTLAQCKQYLNIADDPDIITTGSFTIGSDIITAVPTTDGIDAGDTIKSSALVSSALISAVPSSGTMLVIGASAAVSGTGVTFTISDRGSEYDDMITLYIPVVEAFINRYCSETFGTSTNPWPADLLPVAAKMIWLNVSAPTSTGIKTSESLGDYSVSYATGQGVGTYSPDILAALALYRKVFFI